MKKILLPFFKVAIVLLSILSLTAQELPEIIPPSPEAASFAKFTEVPVSHYTGVPNISIPITTFKVGGKTFPVSLSYHARGVKVSEIASRVGLGWALNAGGQISRQVRGKADDGEYGYFSSSIVQDYASDNLDEILDTCCISNYPGANEEDKFPDQFNLQVGSLSAKFIFDYKDFKPLIQKYDDIIIEHNNTSSGLIGSFLVTDKDGYKYTFGGHTASNMSVAIENRSYSSSGDYTQNSASGGPTYNTWLLNKIESPNGEIATFIYEPETSNLIERSYDEYLGGAEYINHSTVSQSTQYQLYEIRYNYNSNGYDKIVFEPSQDYREDTQGTARALNAIKIYKQIYDDFSYAAYILIKSYALHHSYMESNDSNEGNHHPLLLQNDPTASKRLMLDSIVETGKNTTITKPPYRLTYNTEVLPNRFSNSQDLWGHYNGADNGFFLDFFSKNRRIDTILSQAAMLEKITYPTGGSVKFTYEHNRGIKGSEYDNSWFPSVNPSELKTIGVTNLDPYYTSGGLQNHGYYEGGVKIVNSRTKFNVNVNLPPWDGNSQNEECTYYDDNVDISNCEFRIVLTPLDNTNAPILGEQQVIWSDHPPIWLDPGRYRLIVEVPGGWFQAQQSSPLGFTVNLIGQDQIANEDTVLYSAGKRISKVEFLDSDNSPLFKKHYNYNNSGVILSVPFFADIVEETTIAGQTAYFFGGASAIPGKPMGTFQGNTIGYKRVTEYFGSQENNQGKTEYTFNLMKDSGDYMTHPISVPTDNEWLRGLPLKVEYYKKDSNDSYTKVKSNLTSYLLANDFVLNPNAPDMVPVDFNLMPQTVIYPREAIPNSLPDIFYEKTNTFYRLPLVHFFNPYESIFEESSDDFYVKITHLTGGTLSAYETTETLFDVNEQPTLVTKTTTDYNYDNHYQPAAATSVTSDGKPVMQSYTYPQDLVSDYTVHPDTYSIGDPIQALAEQHRFVPIETKTYKDLNNDGYTGYPQTEEILSTTTTEYDWFGNLLEPSKVLTKKRNDNPEDRIEFNGYDSRGNVLEVTKANGTHTAYIWGYNDTYPIAKLENTSYDNISPAQQSVVDAVKLASDLDNDNCIETSCKEEQLRTALANLRDAFPDTMVTTYTYDPLIGVTSMTDPRGQTVYYEYDVFNRLKQVRDDDDNIISQNEYNYGSQN